MMIFFVLFLVISSLIFHQPTKGSEIEKKKHGMSFQEQMALLKMQYKILEKEMELKEKDYKIVVRKSKAERMDKFDAALKSLTQDVTSNTKNIRRSLKTIKTLSTEMKGVDSRLKGVSGDVQGNTNLLKVLNRDRCQTGVLGLHSFPRRPSWPARKIIRFNPPFSSTPSVVHGFYVLDNWKDRNLRATVTVSNISKTGFTLQIGTFADTVLYGFGVRWMACR